MWGVGEPHTLLPGLLAHADAIDLRDATGWDAGQLGRLNRLAAPQASLALAAPSEAHALAGIDGAKAGLQRAGFVFTPHTLNARFAPRHTPPPMAGGLWPELADARRHAMVLGAGLAGCSATLALRQAGWRVTLLDALAGPAQATSGNPGGLFHSILHAQDGVHARAHRAASLATWQQAMPWVRSQRIQGQCQGLLRLDPKTTDDAARTLLRTQAWPPEHVRWLSLNDAQAWAGMPVPSGGWLFAQGGWLHPAGFAQAMLDEALACEPLGKPSGSAQPGLFTQWQQRVHSLRRLPTAQGLQWQALDEQGRVLSQAPVLVLANAMHALPLLASLPAEQSVSLPPMSAIRGQITTVPAGDWPLPQGPVAGSGYALALNAHTLLCGATTQHHDPEPAVREADHRHNLLQARRLGTGPQPTAQPDGLPDGLQGRVGWRAATPDRLPLVGALPWSAERLATQSRARLDQVRQIPRERDTDGGLYMLCGLGSRGITWSALAGRLLAHWVAGTPCPIEADLRDAMDPARFLARDTAKRG